MLCLIGCRNETKKPGLQIQENTVFLIPKHKSFTYDHVFDQTSSQQQVFHVIKPIINQTLEGINGCIFAYGQTGSGKTYSMLGDLSTKSNYGIIPKSIDSIFDMIENQTTQTSDKHETTFLIMASCLEIYNEKIEDLLVPEENRQSLQTREKRDKTFYVPHLSEHLCNNRNKMMHLAQKALSNRRTAKTDTNSESSRSHCIFTISIEKSVKEILSKTMDEISGKISVEFGPAILSKAKLQLVDLAGSEKLQSQSSVLQKESVQINLSLHCLAHVISLLAKQTSQNLNSNQNIQNQNNPMSHVPYRNSTLTRLLKDCLGGNANTFMIANINPCLKNIEESLNTLRYASRTKKIKNKPIQNHDPKDMMILRLQQEIDNLKNDLQQTKQHNVLRSSNETDILDARIKRLLGSFIQSPNAAIFNKSLTTTVKFYSTFDNNLQSIEN